MQRGFRTQAVGIASVTVLNDPMLQRITLEELLAKMRNKDESLISNVWAISRGMRDTHGYWQEFGKRGRRRPA